MNQKGIAYLLVLILGGIIVTSSIVYYSSTVIESRVSTNSRMSKEVFYFTESRMNEAISMILKGNITINPENPLPTFTQIFPPVPKDNNLYQLSSNVTFKDPMVLTMPNTAGVDDTITDDQGNPVQVKKYIESKEITYNVTAQGNLVKSGKNLLPRKVGGLYKFSFLRFRYEKPGSYGNYTSSNSTISSWPGFNYAITTGGNSDFIFEGSSKIRNGGLFSNKGIDLGNPKLRIDGGEAYSVLSIYGKGTITPRPGKPAKNINQDPINFPIINIDYYKSIADRSYGLGVVNYTLTLNSFTDLNPLPIDSSINDPKDVAVVYVDGNLKITGRFVNTQSILLVVKGTVTMTGNSDIGSPTIPFSIIAGGDINRSTGNAEVNGFYYTTRKIEMQGSFTLTGSLAAAQGVKFTGNATVCYDKSLAEKLPLILDPDDPNYSKDTTITVTASPGTINPPGSSTLTWSTQNVTELTVTPSIGLSPMPVNNQTGTIVSPQTTTTYTFTATGTGGTVTVKVTVIVTDVPPTPGTTTYSKWVIIPNNDGSKITKWWQKID